MIEQTPDNMNGPQKLSLKPSQIWSILCTYAEVDVRGHKRLICFVFFKQTVALWVYLSTVYPTVNENTWNSIRGHLIWVTTRLNAGTSTTPSPATHCCITISMFETREEQNEEEAKHTKLSSFGQHHLFTNKLLLNPQTSTTAQDCQRLQ